MAEGKSRETESSSFVSEECLYELVEHCFKTPYKASSADRKVHKEQLKIMYGDILLTV